MARFFDRSRTYIFLAPVAIIAMSDNGGCASSKVEALSAEQVKSQVVGNTVHKEDAYAYIASDNTIKAEISQTDAIETDRGIWKLSDDGEFCVTWQVTEHGKNNCSKFQALEDNKLQWGDHTLAVFKGNPKNL